MKQPFLSRVPAAIKAATNVLFSGYGGQQVNTSGGWDSWQNWGSRPGTGRDYETTVGDLWQNSAVMACIAWMQRTFPEASVQVTQNEGGTQAEVERHGLTQLLARPNPYYSSDSLWQRTILSWVVSGNAYWFKAKDGTGTVRELYHLPYWQMRPIWDTSGTEFIGGYLQTVDGKRREIAREDVVHFRYGAHPRNERMGWSPLLAGLVEVDTDNEGGIYASAILRNQGIAGLLSPKDPNAALSQPAKEYLKAMIRAQSTGDQRGGILTPDVAMEYTQFGKSPEEMALDKLRTVPEDRICALLGIPAMVVGLTSGANTKTYANYAEAREAAFEQNIIPAQEMFAAELQLQLLPDFSKNPQERVGWDRRHVRVLQPDKDKEWARVCDAKAKGILTVDEARKELGFDDLPNGEGTVREPIGRAISEAPDGPTPLPVEGRGPALNGRNGNGKQPASVPGA